MQKIPPKFSSSGHWFFQQLFCVRRTFKVLTLYKTLLILSTTSPRIFLTMTKQKNDDDLQTACWRGLLSGSTRTCIRADCLNVPAPAVLRSSWRSSPPCRRRCGPRRSTPWPTSGRCRGRLRPTNIFFSFLNGLMNIFNFKKCQWNFESLWHIEQSWLELLTSKYRIECNHDKTIVDIEFINSKKQENSF